MCGSLPARGQWAAEWTETGRRFQKRACRRCTMTARVGGSLRTPIHSPRPPTGLHPARTCSVGMRGCERGGGRERGTAASHTGSVCSLLVRALRPLPIARVRTPLSHSLSLSYPLTLLRSDTVSSRSRARMWEQRAIGHSALTRRLNIVATPNSTGTQTHKPSTFSFTHLLTLTLTLTMWSWCWCWCW